MGIDRPLVPVILIVPDQLKELGAGEDLPWLGGQGLQKVKLLGGQVTNRLVVEVDFPGLGVHLKVIGLDIKGIGGLLVGLPKLV